MYTLIYTFNIGDSMKGKMKGIIQLALSILIFVLFNLFYFKVLGLFKISLSGTSYVIANFIKYLLITLIAFVIYNGNIRAGKNKFNKTFLNSVIYCVSCFVFLVVITILLHEGLNKIANPKGIKIAYEFTNYFSQKFTLDFALNFVREAILMPILLCIIFVLGISNIIKRTGAAGIISGLVYGIIYAIGLNANFEYALFHAITPACIVMLLTYLYKTNQNIFSVFITYICYVLFGIFAIGYIL